MANCDGRCDRGSGLVRDGMDAGGLGGFWRVVRMIMAVTMLWDAVSVRKMSMTEC